MGIKHGNQLNKVWEKIASNWVTSICLWEKEKEKRKHCCHLEIEYEKKTFAIRDLLEIWCEKY